MIQKKIKKWYPTKERENEDKRLARNRETMSRLNEAAETMNRISRNQYDYIVTSPEVARALQNVLQNVQYGNMGVDYTTTESEPQPQQESVKPSTWQTFKEDFGEWKWSNFWFKLKAYITSFIKLGITLILIFPLALVLSFLPMNYKETKSISEKITDFWGDK